MQGLGKSLPAAETVWSPREPPRERGREVGSGETARAGLPGEDTCLLIHGLRAVSP